MNAFDATRTGAGDTGLASLFAATAAPANGQGAQNAAQGTTPFAQLLDQLNGLPMPQGSGAETSPTLAPSNEVAPALSALPVRHIRQTAGDYALKVAQADRAPARGTALDCGLRLPATGKIVPLPVTGGTILPAEPATELPPGDEPGVIADLPAADQPAGPLGQYIPGSVPVIAALAINTPLAVPARSTGGSVRPDPAGSHDAAMPAVIAPTITTAPAVTLTAASAPIVAGGEAPSAEHGSKEATFTAASVRQPMPVVPEQHGSAHAAEPIPATPHARPEPQPLAMQDLTQIVERLAAAREAAAPAATQLAVEHAEFGPLSLSIRQGDRGELAVAVAATDRDSQAALVAAIAQGEASGFEHAPDRRGSESSPRDATTGGQPGEQRGQGNAQRDRFAGQQQRQAMPQRDPARGQDGETRNGTYA